MENIKTSWRTVDYLVPVRSLFRAPAAWTSEPLGVDLSDNQGNLDAAAMYRRGVRFAYLRTGIGTSYVDKRFQEYWDKLQAVGILVAPYHVLRADQRALDQVDALFYALGWRTLTMPPCWDIERHDKQSKATITTRANEVLQSTSIRTGRACIGYSARWFLDAYMMDSGWYNDYDWWLAQYLPANPLTGYAAEHPGPVRLPNGISQDSVFIHQTAGKAKGKLDGFGVDSLNIDTDRWLQGGLASLYNWAGVPLPAPTPTLDERVTDLERRMSNLEAHT
jgi:hypothetical protein